MFALGEQKIVDAHCHLADSRWGDRLASQIAQASRAGIGAWIQGGMDPDDWAIQTQLVQKYPNRVYPTYGWHPYRVLEAAEKFRRPEDWNRWLADAESQLAAVLPPSNHEHQRDRVMLTAPDWSGDGSGDRSGDGSGDGSGWVGVGELGIDLVPRRLEELGIDKAWATEAQIQVFRMQLRLALERDLPVVLHVVRGQAQILRVLEEATEKMPAGVHLRGLVHSFSGGIPECKRYVKLGLLISLSGSVTRAGLAPVNAGCDRGSSEQRLADLVAQVPRESLVIETDAPDQVPRRLGTDDHELGALNPLTSLIEIAQFIGSMRGETGDEVLARSRENLVRDLRLDPRL